MAVAAYLASWASNVSDYCGELTRWDTLTGKLGEPWRFVGRRRWPGDVMTGVFAHPL